MKLSDFIKAIGFVTLLCLGYVHMQMQIIDMAYQGKSKEKKIRQLIEENGNVTYAILSLKSSANLGHQLLAENTDMTFADPENVVKISNADDLNADSTTQVAADFQDKSVFRFLSLGASAQAQPQQ